MAGRRLIGTLFAVFFILLQGTLIILLLHPKTPWSFLNSDPLDYIRLFFWLIIAGDGFRYSIPCLGKKKWSLYLLICVGVPLLLAFAVRGFVVQPFKIPTGAMSPTLKGNRKDLAGNDVPGDHVLVSRLAYRFHEPQRGDVVAFKTTGLPMVQQNTHYVKRVVGLPGETVGIDSPYVTINGARVTEPQIFARIAGRKDGQCGYVTAGLHPSKTFCLASPTDRITLGPDEYFVLGDNSTNSFDGRYWGPIKRRSIIGRVFYINAPTGRKRVLD